MKTTKRDFNTKYHRDGLITYWSVYRQTWVKCVSNIPNRELAAMSPRERDWVMKHLGKVD
jgi:hypothetical protein